MTNRRRNPGNAVLSVNEQWECRAYTIFVLVFGAVLCVCLPVVVNAL